MITLEVESYCHKCDRFVPTAERRSTLRCVPLFGKAETHADDCAVVCMYRDSCRGIEQVIRSEIAAKEERNDSL
nr:MAG TPA: hypothetical protein [Caudoviricetes sp.]